jgi:ABC-type glycerol-3-phosphate transport system permease component
LRVLCGLENVAAPVHTSARAVVPVIALFYSVAHWNDFFAATLYLNDADKWPIQLVLRQYVLQGSVLALTPDPNQHPPTAQTIQMAVVVIVTVPILDRLSVLAALLHEPQTTL